MSTCKKCGAEIVWHEIDTGNGKKWHPYNIDGITSHFKTCPYAKEFMPNRTQTVKAEVKTELNLDDWLLYMESAD
jgi:hypothetical protein